MMQRPWVRITLAILVLLLFLGACVILPNVVDLGLSSSAPSNDQAEVVLTVGAASDLIPAFEEIGERFNETTPYLVEFTFGSSGLLAQQIEAGAPIDVYASADFTFVDYLRNAGLIIDETVTQYAIGRIVVWSLDEENSAIANLNEFMSSDFRRIAIANPNHAPYGRAAKDALISAGVWEDIQPKLVLGSNIREAMQYAETGNVDVALVALSLALATEEGHWSEIPADRHAPIDQTLGIVASTDHRDAANAFVEKVMDDEGQEILRKYGFEIPYETSE
jgi:molybdate transport system substrate-binding protein